MDEATKRPWLLTVDDDGAPRIHGDFIETPDETRSTIIFEPGPHPETYGIQRANAELIVKCVTEHDDGRYGMKALQEANDVALKMTMRLHEVADERNLLRDEVARLKALLEQMAQQFDTGHTKVWDSVEYREHTEDRIAELETALKAILDIPDPISFNDEMHIARIHGRMVLAGTHKAKE